MNNSLENFIHPIDCEAFFKKYLNSKEYFFVESNSYRKSLASNLFNWDDLNNLLNLNLIDYPRFRLASEGKVIPKENYIKYFPNGDSNFIEYKTEFISSVILNGGTIIIDAINLMNKKLYNFSKDLSSEIGTDLQINLYASWGDKHGFDLHWDDHDVFIFQLIGKKKWELYGTTEESPNRRMKSVMIKPEEKIKEIILNSGDLLFVPRGHWHDVTPINEPSLHLTIGVKYRTGIDLLSWLMIKNNNNFPSYRRDISINNPNLSVLYENIMSDFSSVNEKAIYEFVQHNDNEAYNLPILSIPFLNKFIENNLEFKFKVYLNSSRKIRYFEEDNKIHFNYSSSKHSFPLVFKDLLIQLFEEKYLDNEIIFQIKCEKKHIHNFLKYLVENSIVEITF